MTAHPLVVAPLRIEAHALRRAGRVARVGMGEGAASRLPPGDAPVLVAGFGGALSTDLEPGDIVVATHVVAPYGDRIACDDARGLCASLERAGFSPRAGAIASAAKVVRGRRRAQLAETGALAVDLESFWVAEAAARRPFAAVRVIVDSPSRELFNPLATLAGGLRAYKVLSRAAAVLGAWRPLARAGYAESTTPPSEEPCPSL